MHVKLTSKFLDDDINDMQLQLDDSDGQLLHLQREEGAVQASVAMTPSRATIAEWVSLW